MKHYDAYLCGYYGMQNSGDDALMYASAWGARKFLDAKTIRLSSRSDLQLPVFSDCPQTLQSVQRFRGQHRLQNYHSAIRSRRIIFGGGSVLHNAHDINLKLDMMRLSGSSGHLALGVGLGPFANSEAERACARFLNRCDFVGLRDRDSYAMARALAPDANVKLTFDLAPLLLCHDDFTLATVPRRGIAFNLCPVEHMDCQSPQDQRRLRETARSIELLWQQSGEDIFLIDLNGHTEFGDTRLHRQLMAMIAPTVPVHCIGYDANPLRLLQRLASYKAIVSMRLHGAVLGFMADTPVLSINYHSKCEGWCNQIGMPQEYRLDAKNFSGEALALNLLKGLSNGFTRPELSPSAATDFALANWSHSDVTH